MFTKLFKTFSIVKENLCVERVAICISIFPFFGESSPFSVLPSLVGIVRGGERREEEGDTASASKRKKQQQQQKRGGMAWHQGKEKRLSGIQG